MRLSELTVGQAGEVVRIEAPENLKRRLMEIGFVEGATVTVASQAPLSDPREYIVRGVSITLRSSEARKITMRESRHGSICCDHCAGGRCYTLGCCGAAMLAKEGNRAQVSFSRNDTPTLRVALVGNPNCGKTALFNSLCGGHEHEANYAGCTVDSHIGHLEWHGVSIEIVDLPGTCSLASFSPEEQYVENYLQEHRPDVIINVLDATHLHRNLLLTTQLYPLGIPMVGALTMADTLERRGEQIDTVLLGERIGFPCTMVKSRAKQGTKKLLDSIIDHASHTYDYPQLELPAEDIEECSRMRWHFVDSVLEGVCRCATTKERLTARLDRIVTHRIWGFPIFFAVLFALFEFTFILGDYPMQGIEWLIGRIGECVGSAMSEGWLRDLIVDGVIAGVGSVIVFLPNILILYFFISLLEDTGYMSRAAYIMDRLMRSLGLQGNSFMPMVMGFGCGVPAIMACRSIANRRSRLITILITPFMSCSARLPIFVLFASAFFPRSASLVVMGMYLAGILAGLLSAKLLSWTLPSKHETPFIMEMPEYRTPSLRSALHCMWDKASQYLRKMGGVVLLASALIWALGYFPHNESLTSQQQQEQSYLGQLGKGVSPLFAPMGADWRMSISILTGLSAKEVVVSTLGVLYNADDESDALQQQLPLMMTPAAAVAFMLFCLLYMPCIAAIAAIRKESGSWYWALFSILYSTLLAWLVAVTAYHLLL